MTATYDNTLATTADRLRFRLGDTDTADTLLSDEEIAAVLALKSNDEDQALLYLAKGLIRRWAREPVHVTADGTTLDFGERVGAWREIVSELTKDVSTGLRVRRLAKPQLITGQGEYTT